MSDIFSNAIVQNKKPDAHRIKDVLHCDRLPYPTNYIKHNIFCVIYVPKDQESINKARYAIDLMIKSGVLSEQMVRIRMAVEQYNFEEMINGFLYEQTNEAAKRSHV